MNGKRWRWVAVCLALAGCAQTASSVDPEHGSDDRHPTTPASTTSTSAPATTAVGATPDDVTPASSGSVVETTTFPGGSSCADFDALLGFERMMAVKGGTAPAEAECAAAVERSALALRTYETALVFSEQLASADQNQLAESGDCGEPTVFTNIFDVPIIYWGITALVDDDEIVGYEPFNTTVIQPGASRFVQSVGLTAGDATEFCVPLFEGVVAPTGDLAAGIDAAPAPADDPLASDDANVWGAAVYEAYAWDMTNADHVNYVEDIHSPDVGDHIQALETGEPGWEPRSPIYTVCDAAPADLGADIVGEFAWLRISIQTTEWQLQQLGLFSRGADRRWRFLGTAKTIADESDPNDPCAVPPTGGSDNR